MSGVGVVLLMAAIDQVQRSSQFDFAAELVSFAVLILIIALIEYIASVS